MDEQVPPKDEQATADPSPESGPQHEAEDYAEASHSTADFVKNIAPLQEKKQKGRKKLLITLIVLLVLAGLGAGGYFAYKSLTKPKPAQPVANTQPQTANTPSDTELSEHYKSQDLKLAFDHPKSWKVTDSTSGRLKLTSPVIKLKEAGGQATDAKVVMTILSNPVDLTGFSAAATAVLDSEKVAYIAPTQTQRKETFLSFIGSSTTSAGITAVYITGDSGYTKGQPVQKNDVIKVQPIVSLQFYKCDAACEGEGAGPLTLAPDTWAGDTNLQTAKSIIRSLVIE